MEGLIVDDILILLIYAPFVEEGFNLMIAFISSSAFSNISSKWGATGKQNLWSFLAHGACGFQICEHVRGTSGRKLWVLVSAGRCDGFSALDFGHQNFSQAFCMPVGLYASQWVCPLISSSTLDPLVLHPCPFQGLSPTIRFPGLTNRV